MIVFTTPTGHIGSQVVRNLLGANEAVRVIARQPDRIAPEVRAEVEIVQGSSDDEGVLMRALVSQRVKRVVSVSGVGRRVGVQAGPVTASFAKDAEIEKTGVEFRALRCPSFIENMLPAIPSLKQHCMFSNSGRPDVKAPLVATRDIASSGAKLLLDRSWTGQGGLAMLGPEDLYFDDMADIMTDVFRRPIRFQSVPGEAYKVQLFPPP